MTTVAQMSARRAEKRFYMHFPSVLNTFTLFCGEQGRGKTVSGIYLAQTIKRWVTRFEGWTPRVVVIATEIGITPEFGPHVQLPVSDFICQLRGINLVAELFKEQIADENMSDEQIDDLFTSNTGCSNPAHQDGMIQYGNQWITEEKAATLSEKQRVQLGEKGSPCWSSKNGVVLYRAIVLCDEAHELLSSDMTSNPVVRLMCNFVAKMRHFKITLLVMAPSPQDIARRARAQVTWETWCNTRKQRLYDGTLLATGTTATFKRPGVNRDGRGVFSLKFDPNDYFPMYDSHQLLSFSGRAINIDSKFI